MIFMRIRLTSVVPLGTTVLDAIAGIEIGVDAVAGVTAHGLINLLVGIMS